MHHHSAQGHFVVASRMSRARNIKPGFFKNEVLVALPFEHRLLFVGLWTLADRDGRLEDRPVRIKMEIFPADNVAVDEALCALHDSGFIRRYQVDGARFIQISAWAKHQNPHVKEAASTIPAPCEHGASTVQASEIPERAGLIPDSGFSDSLTEERVASQPRVSLTLPAWLPAQAWADWHAFRNTRKGWTSKARELSLLTLTKLRTKGHDPTAVIEQSIERGWTGLFELKTDQQNANRTPSRNLSAIERVEQAIADRLDREGNVIHGEIVTSDAG